MPRICSIQEFIEEITVKDGVSVARFKISRADGQKIKGLERTQGHDAALAALRPAPAVNGI
jgi:hypothetical protein